MLEAVQSASATWPKPPEFKPNYGTAGFRALASLLPSTVFRCGLLMAARALKTQRVTGICITASHNPAPDNGVKLVDPSGEMLCQDWEAHANQLANAETDEQLGMLVVQLLQMEGITMGSGKVLIAHDTRPSSPELAAAAAAGVRALGLQPEVLGLLTTPQLHWIVMRTNKGLASSEQAYYAELADAFQQLVADTQPLCPMLYVDCANGVGAPKLQALSPLLQPAGLTIELRNTGAGVLNGDCGSDFLQKSRQLPQNFGDVPAGARCCSLDGDADRLMYFRPVDETPGQALVFDGDRIAVLSALLLRKLMSQLPASMQDTSLGIVQTAYANGSASTYVREQLGCTVQVTPTGVKYLHEAAHHYDVGIYFEANGHGTVLFSKGLVARLQQVAAENRAASQLLALACLINQAVGDAISGILLVEVALRRLCWDLTAWATLYTDLPSRQLPVKVADRTAIVTTDAETRVVQPAGLQKLIDQAVAAVPSGRSFVRPSGTEDLVRVFAEAATQDAADGLAAAVAKLVQAQLSGAEP